MMKCMTKRYTYYLLHILSDGRAQGVMPRLGVALVRSGVKIWERDVPLYAISEL